MLRVRELLSGLTLTISNFIFFYIFFVLSASTKDGPIKLFCRLLFTECGIYHVFLLITLCFHIFSFHLTLNHCILTLCVREVSLLVDSWSRFAHTLFVKEIMAL